MIGIAEVVSAPGLATVDGVRLYSAEADVGAPKKRMRLLIVPAADGDFCPVQLGDRVLVGCAAGVAYMLRALLANTEDAGTDLHRYIQPPGVRQGGGEIASPEVRVGDRDGGAWESVMLYAQAHFDLLQLKSTLSSAVTQLLVLVAGLAVPGATPGSAAALVNVTALTNTLSDLAAALGGKASVGLQSRGSA